jgi:hypothetical protein
MTNLPQQHDDDEQQQSEQQQKQSRRWRWRLAIRDDGRLSWRAKLVACCSLVAHMNEDGGSCFPKIETVARECAVGRDTVLKALKELETREYLRVKHGGGRRKRNEYSVRFPKQSASATRKQSTSASETVAEVDSRSDKENDKKQKDKNEDLGCMSAAMRPEAGHDDDTWLSVVPDAEVEQIVSDVFRCVDRDAVVRCFDEVLLPVVRELHKRKRVSFNEQRSSRSFAKLIRSETQLHEGHISHVADKLSGNAPDRRFHTFDIDGIGNPGGFARGALRLYFDDYSPTELPWTYEQLKGSYEEESG